MLEPIRNRHKDVYANETLPSFPRLDPQPWNHNYGSRIGDLRAIRKYAAEISAIDDGVGKIMLTLKELELDANTLVVFTADQGMSGGHSGYWGMGDHTRPLTAFDWTTHIPLIFRYPKRISQNKRVDLLVSNVDFMPTMKEFLNLPPSERTQPKPPGQSFASVLRGDVPPAWDQTVYYEFENVRAIRTKEWKYIERFRESPNELYDLRSDPGELNNLIDDPRNTTQRQTLRQRLHAYFDRIADPRWDLWKSGSSKSGLIQTKLFDNPGPSQPPKPSQD